MALMKVKQVGKAQKDAGDCGKCGKPIKKGDPYQWMKGFRGPKYVRCATCPTWTTAERESGPMRDAYAAQETAHDAIDALEFGDYSSEGGFAAQKFVEDLKGILSQCGAEASSAKDQIEESLDNMPEGLRDGDTGTQMQERIDNLESWIDDLDSWSPTGEEELPTDAEDQGDYDDWFDGLKQEAHDAVEELEV